MRVTHYLRVTALCPADGLSDIYSVEVEASRVIKVEDIIAVSASFAGRKIFQEDLTSEMARRLTATVRTVGYHSGVRTKVEA